MREIVSISSCELCRPRGAGTDSRIPAYSPRSAHELIPKKKDQPFPYVEVLTLVVRSGIFSDQCQVAEYHDSGWEKRRTPILVLGRVPHYDHVIVCITIM